MNKLNFTLILMTFKIKIENLHVIGYWNYIVYVYSNNSETYLTINTEMEKQESWILLLYPQY